MREAARLHDCTRQAVHLAWRKLYPNEPLPRVALQQANRAKILELAEAGKTVPEISADLKLSQTMIKEALRESRDAALAETSAALDLAIQEVQSGKKTAVDAAIDAGIGLWTLTRKLAKLGIKSKRGSTEKTGRVARAVALVQGGMPVADASRQERCATSAVYASLAKLKRATSEVPHSEGT